MANDVYSPTTAPNPESSCFKVPSKLLDKPRFILKVCEVLLSLVAFILEEMVGSCSSCNPLYFFEFVSCTAFLFTLLLLILLSTKLHEKVNISCWPKVDFVYTATITALFFISSIIFAVDNGGSDLESVAVAFGFLSTVAFVVDLVFFMKTNGFPFRDNGATDPNNGSPVTAEAEKLNREANGGH
uniref:CKLF-like MARVEL transmembrane domain containing 6 n=1 Tax=Iconisemion striatum TaxID=60296 RepID=A0A1A7XQ90_9TELE